jgi:hypothetical protein
MKRFLFSLVLVCAPCSWVEAETFNTPVSVSTNTVDFFPAANLIQGPGVGFDANEPHDKLLSGQSGNWVTNDPGGFPSDYIAAAGPPILVFDMGEDVWMDEVSVWGYAATNANGVSEFSLQFATEADGPSGFTAAAGPFYPTNDEFARQSFEFGATYKARYVQFVATDNFFVAPGTGAGGEIPGGDRVGLGEVSFRQAVPEPATGLLVLLGVLGLGARRRR